MHGDELRRIGCIDIWRTSRGFFERGDPVGCQWVGRQIGVALRDRQTLLLLEGAQELDRAFRRLPGLLQVAHRSLIGGGLLRLRILQEGHERPRRLVPSAAWATSADPAGDRAARHGAAGKD